MSHDALITAVLNGGAWARGNNKANVKHYFLNNNSNMITSISKCWMRVALLDNLCTPDDAMECFACRQALDLERSVQRLKKS